MRSKRVLIVDDEPINIAIMEELLSDDYETTSVESGEAAISLVPVFRPDLVLLDVMMPGIDGYETCRVIRSDPELRNIVIIMVSAKSTFSDAQCGLSAGADEYIPKPFNHGLFCKTVREQLTRVGGQCRG